MQGKRRQTSLNSTTHPPTPRCCNIQPTDTSRSAAPNPATPCRCLTCPTGQTPNLGRTGCETNGVESDCIPRPADSLSLSFDCPRGWTLLPAGTTQDAPAGCMPPDTAASVTCRQAWANLGSAVVGSFPTLVDFRTASNRLACRCNRAAQDGFVLRRQLDGSFACVAEAAFLPSEGKGTDSPSLDGRPAGIWYDVRPGKSCNGAQQW